MAFYGKLFLFCRAVVRLVLPRYQVIHPERAEEPAVYLCRHSDLQGIFMTLPWLPVPVRLWGLHVFGEPKACYEHFRDVTFTRRYGWPRWKATVLAKLASWGLPPLYKSAGVIPVYRGSGQAIKTFRMSLDALMRGESLLIFPDKDYTSTDSEVSELYEGFLRLDRFYYRRTGEHIPFIALYGDRVRRTLTIHPPLRLKTGSEAEMAEMIQTLRKLLSGPAPGDLAGQLAE